MTPEDVLEITQRGFLRAPLRRRDWVIGRLSFFRAIGIVRASDDRYVTLHPAAAVFQIERFADLTD